MTARPACDQPDDMLLLYGAQVMDEVERRCLGEALDRLRDKGEPYRESDARAIARDAREGS